MWRTSGEECQTCPLSSCLTCILCAHDPDSRERLKVSTRPEPVPTEETRPYWEGAKAGKLLIQKCSACGALQFYPRTYCTHCLSESMAWIEASGRGEIYTFTINHRAANEYMKDKTP